jgi:hypothetical protein
MKLNEISMLAGEGQRIEHQANAIEFYGRCKLQGRESAEKINISVQFCSEKSTT